MSDSGWGIVFILGLAIVITTVIVVVVWQIFKTTQTKVEADALVASSDGYRRLAAESTAAQQKVAEEQERIAEALDDLRARVATIEKLLADVG